MAKKPKGYWTYERCKNEAQKYSSKKEFYHGCISAYNTAKSHKWLDEWFDNLIKSCGYWTKERCYEAAMECTSRSMFREKYGRAYALSIKYGWINEWIWLKRQIHEGSDYWIYVYEDEENKVVYVGLTWKKERHREHECGKIRHGVRKFDVLARYWQSIGKPLPNPRIKMTELDAENAQYYEDWYKKKYAENGWTVLNKAATGVGVGSLGGVNVIWEYDNCKEEALKYKTKNDFRKNSGGAYSAARRNGWLNEWFGEYNAKPVGYWTKEQCIEEGRKYKTRSEFAKSSSTAYGISCDNGWIDEIGFEDLRKPAGYWTYDRCKEEAKKYRTQSDFIKGCSSAYNVAYEKGWLKEYNFEEAKKPNGYWKNYEHCKEAASGFSSISEFSEKYYAAWYWSKKFGWLDEFFHKSI